MSWWVHELWESGQRVELIAWIFWVLLSITLHELGHGWAALQQGDDTPRRLGRMTLNPFVQMGMTSIIVFLLIGIAWGAMPVNPYRFRQGRIGRVFVAAAGPATNLALTLIASVLLIGWLAIGPQQSDPMFRNVAVFLFYGAFLNVVLAGFNLLPIPPLDGSKILEGFSRKAEAAYAHPQAPMFGLFALFAIMLSGLFDSAFVGAMLLVVLAVDTAGGLLGSPDIISVMQGA